MKTYSSQNFDIGKTYSRNHNFTRGTRTRYYIEEKDIMNRLEQVEQHS